MASEIVFKGVRIKQGPGFGEIVKCIEEPIVVQHLKGWVTGKTIKREVSFSFDSLFHSGIGWVIEITARITRYGRGNQEEYVEGEILFFHFSNDQEQRDWWERAGTVPSKISTGVQISGHLPRYFHGSYSSNIRIGSFTLDDNNWESEYK